MPQKATAADAQLVLQLYDLRREPEMRKARQWWLVTFWPQTADDFMKVVNAFGTQENAWLRQVLGYWDMAASLLLHGAIHPDLFLEGGISGEMFFLFAKVNPILKEIRQKMQSPNFLANVEKAITGSKTARKRFEAVSARVAARGKAIAEAKAS
jgi:hypothetical protein